MQFLTLKNFLGLIVVATPFVAGIGFCVLVGLQSRFEIFREPRRYWAQLCYVVWMATAIALVLMGAGCTLMPDPMTQPTIIRSDRSPPKVWVYRRCAEDAGKLACHLYDGWGTRRYDCERDWSDCKVY